VLHIYIYDISRLRVKEDQYNPLRVDRPELDSQEGLRFLFSKHLDGLWRHPDSDQMGTDKSSRGKGDGAWIWPVLSSGTRGDYRKALTVPTWDAITFPLTFTNHIICVSTNFLPTLSRTWLRYCWEKCDVTRANITTLHHSVACWRGHDVNTGGGSRGGRGEDEEGAGYLKRWTDFVFVHI